MARRILRQEIESLFEDGPRWRHRNRSGLPGWGLLRFAL